MEVSTLSQPTGNALAPSTSKVTPSLHDPRPTFCEKAWGQVFATVPMVYKIAADVITSRAWDMAQEGMGGRILITPAECSEIKVRGRMANEFDCADMRLRLSRDEEGCWLQTFWSDEALAAQEDMCGAAGSFTKFLDAGRMRIARFLEIPEGGAEDYYEGLDAVNAKCASTSKVDRPTFEVKQVDYRGTHVVLAVYEAGHLIGYLRNDEEMGRLEVVSYALSDCFGPEGARIVTQRFLNSKVGRRERMVAGQ